VEVSKILQPVRFGGSPRLTDLEMLLAAAETQAALDMRKPTHAHLGAADFGRTINYVLAGMYRPRASEHRTS